MLERTRPRADLSSAVIGLSLVLALIGSMRVVVAEASLKDNLQFAVEMAKAGNWREARYRWELADRRRPGDPLILNNLAVASEALGDVPQARALYERALAAARGDSRIAANHQRSERFWRRADQAPEAEDGDPHTGNVPAADAGRGGGRGKAIRVSVMLDVPARLDLEDARTLLVASFLAEENTLLDVNRELVRFLRNEFRKRTELTVLDVTPAPAIPEQTLDDLIANSGFWQHLSREFGSDLIVSGAVTYDRRDASGFRTVDETSPTTGQKIRQTRFVEQEEFIYEVVILFMDGASGKLLFRDRLQRGALFRAQMNDPITAFYELSESIAADILAVVAPRPKQDSRVIFMH